MTRIEIINTGSELMLGRVLNTHQQWLCRQLADAGYEVARQMAVPDTGPAITEIVREGLGRADVIITTGGLGPTSDDITRQLIAELLGAALKEDSAVLAKINEYFVTRQRPQPESTKVQALVPEGATVLMNAFGTAPGLVMAAPAGKFRPGAGALLIMLPGPPRELRPMFLKQVLPMLKEKFPVTGGYTCLTLKSTGVGESRVEEIITPHLGAFLQAGMDLGFCARTGEVDIRFAGRGPGAPDQVAQAAAKVRRLLGDCIYGEGDETLEQCVVRHLTERKQTVALAESCTGGFIANRLTNVSGASAVFWGGMVTYANAAKTALVGVAPELLARHGAVSAPVAEAMAAGARERAGSDYGVAVTGIAGPGGGTPEKPVGTVFIAVASAAGVVSRQQLNRFDRETFKYVTSQQALELLRRAVLGISLPG